MIMELKYVVIAFTAVILLWAFVIITNIKKGE